MKIKLIGTTVDYSLLEKIVQRCKYGEKLEEVMKDSSFLKINYDRMGGTSAGICYMPDSYEKLSSEKEEKSLKRSETTKINGHHSTQGHVHLNLIIEDCPKIVAMFLNNEKEYTTSEKSARYTKMKPTATEASVYEKWVETLKPLIQKERPKASEKQVEKLAMENARYMISVFTPTTMEYTTSYRQINYIYHWAKNMIEDNDKSTKFYQKLKPYMEELCKELEKLGVIDPKLEDQKRYNFSLDKNEILEKDIFTSTFYATSYEGSFAQLAQAQRHRSLSYNINLRYLPITSCYIPEIIKGNDLLEKEWKNDMYSMIKQGNFPQGMNVLITEKGPIEAFIMKCEERLCSSAQYEIYRQTKDTLEKYADSLNNMDLFENEAVEKIFSMEQSYGPRCTFGYNCPNPCGNINRGKI